MNKVQVSVIGRERPRIVCPTQSPIVLMDKLQDAECWPVGMKRKHPLLNIVNGATNLLKYKMFFMDHLAFCQAGLLCILAKADSVRSAVHALDVEATLSRSCQLKHAFKTTNFITMQHMQIVSFAANYWKHFHSTRLICTSGRACMQRIFMKWK